MGYNSERPCNSGVQRSIRDETSALKTRAFEIVV
uniref:Uncharacterized protein n=1 Tax=Arundo donax TaxID=35708 RepID=A0A0A8Y4R0_ARUDO